MMKSYTQRNISTALAVLTGALVTLAGCGGGSDGGSSGGTGAVSLSVIDAPIDDALKVCITFDTVEFKGDSGSTVVNLEVPEKINLLDFQGDNTAPLLVDQELPAGNYQWIRLGVDATRNSNGGLGDTNSTDPDGNAICDGEGSYIVMNDGGVYNLYVPNGAQSGLKLNRGFNVPANGQIYLTADFDLRQSITAPPGQAPDVKLRPTIRLVEINDAGTLEGTVAVERATAENCEPAVFVFNDGVIPNAIETGDVPDPNDPVATATVQDISVTQDMSAYGYKLGFLLEGDYEVAFTCDGETFEPAEGTPATIVARDTTEVDFL